MTLFIYAALFALGAIVASFVGVVAVRLNTGQSFLRGRSRCDACGKTLPARSLVPVLSYAASLGRSHCCGARLSIMSPATEVLLGGLFALSYATLGFSGALLCMLVSLSALLALVLYDLRHQMLPTKLLLIFVFASVATELSRASSAALSLDTIVIAFLLALCLAALHFFSRGRAMGFADAPLVFGLALMVGAPHAFSGFIFSFWIGAVIGIVLLLERPRGSRMGVEVPFAPFLAVGFLLAYFTQWNPFTLIAALL